MQKALVVSALVSTMLLLSAPAFAAGLVSVDLTLVTGAGILQDESKFAMAVLSLDTTGLKTSRSVNQGLVARDGARAKCTVEAESDCSGATISCDDGQTHVVVPANTAGSKGSFDGIEVQEGFIHLKCVNR